MEPTDRVIKLLPAAAIALKDSERRLFMARTVKALGKGGQRLAQDRLGWDRTTSRQRER